MKNAKCGVTVSGNRIKVSGVGRETGGGEKAIVSAMKRAIAEGRKLTGIIRMSKTDAAELPGRSFWLLGFIWHVKAQRGLSRDTYEFTMRTVDDKTAGELARELRVESGKMNNEGTKEQRPRIYVRLPSGRVRRHRVSKSWHKLKEKTQGDRLDKAFGRYGWMQWSFCKLSNK